MDNSYYGQLKIFQTIALEGSISAAARKLEIAVPSASQALKLLEQKIGVPLFHRTTRHIQLTDAGKQLLESTLSAMNELNQAFEEVQNFGQAPTGLVRITMARVVYQQILRPYLAEFNARYPQITLEICLNDGLSHLLEENIDLGIRFGDNLEPSMIARKLTKPVVEGLYISQGYAEKYGVPKTPDALKNHQLIGYRFISANRIEPLVLNIDGVETALELPMPLICNDSEVMLDGLRQGLGIARAFTSNMAQLADGETFIPILKSHWRQYPPLYLYYLQNSQKNRKVQVVIEFLLEKMAEN